RDAAGVRHTRCTEARRWRRREPGAPPSRDGRQGWWPGHGREWGRKWTIRRRCSGARAARSRLDRQRWGRRRRGTWGGAAGGRDQRRQATEELEGGEDELRSTAPPGTLQAVRDHSSGGEAETREGERRSADVAREPLEPEAVVGRDVRAGVEREAFEQGALALAGMAIVVAIGRKAGHDGGRLRGAPGVGRGGPPAAPRPNPAPAP